MRRIAYFAAAIAALAWGAAEVFAIRFANMLWAFLAWATDGHDDPLPAEVVIALTLPPLGFATAVCLSLSAIGQGREVAATKISAASVTVSILFVVAVIWLENSK